MNSGQFGFDTNGRAETNRAKFLQLSQPAQVWRYLPGVGYYLASHPGAFIAQSAGNDWENVCSNPSKAYRTSATALSTSLDGIMVVGVIHHTGEPVKVRLVYPPSMTGRSAIPTRPVWQRTSASNYGPCVDVGPRQCDCFSMGQYTPRKMVPASRPTAGFQPLVHR